jgi:hypothetical protein
MRGVGLSHRTLLLACGLLIAGLAAVSALAEDPSQQCRRHSDCDDGVWCNGEERCERNAEDADDRGCVPARAVACPDTANSRCDEANDRCLTGCDLRPDEDGDGHDSIACGGDDCDDDDPDRFPGNPEDCDEQGHDEDCDPATVGDQDADGDGFVDKRCWNDHRLTGRGPANPLEPWPYEERDVH